MGECVTIKTFNRLTEEMKPFNFTIIPSHLTGYESFTIKGLKGVIMYSAPDLTSIDSWFTGFKAGLQTPRHERKLDVQNN